MARILMVAPYPPARDGIAAYAVQAVARLRAEGHDVEVLSPGPSAAHHHLDLTGPRGPLALAKRVRDYDKVVIQFHPDLFYPQPFADRPWAATSYALAAVFRLVHDLDIVVHETDYARGRMEGTLARAVRFMWQAAPSVTVHTDEERRSFSEAFGVPLERVHVAPHGAHFQRRTTLDRPGARQSLGIPADAFQFLAIGFVQPHKGFDRALRAFGRLGADTGRVRLDVVGSVRLDEPGYLDHADELRALAEATPGAYVHLGYVSDEEFDRWLVAADVVVLPYRHIWSSGVMERAALYERPVIVSRVGGLPTQARNDTVLFDTDDELVDAMAAAAGIARAAVPPWPVERVAVMAAVKERAALVRGPTVEKRRVGPLPPYVPPAPTSARPGVGLLKRAQRRLLAWQLDPIVVQLERLRQAVLGGADEHLARPGDSDRR